MKKIILTMVMLLTTSLAINAMTYQQAREQALYLTDKMAYELNLNEQQYEAAYEINLDYLMNVNTVDDVYSSYWRQRNLDLQYILLDWQYNAFCTASYFYRPLYWSAGNWHFSIYAHYPHRDFFYFSRPACYMSYRGGHSWRHNGGVSWYVNRGASFRNPGGPHMGLRDNFRNGGGRDMRGTAPMRGGNMSNYRDDRGAFATGRRANMGRTSQTGQQGQDYRNGNMQQRNNNRGNMGMQGQEDRSTYNRQSSTRTTVGNNGATPWGGNNSRSNMQQRGNIGGNQHTFTPGGAGMSRGTMPQGGAGMSRGGGATTRGTGGSAAGGHGGRR